MLALASREGGLGGGVGPQPSTGYWLWFEFSFLDFMPLPGIETLPGDVNLPQLAEFSFFSREEGTCSPSLRWLTLPKKVFPHFLHMNCHHLKGHRAFCLRADHSVFSTLSGGPTCSVYSDYRPYPPHFHGG